MKTTKTTLILEFNSDNPSLDNILHLKAKAHKALLESKVLKKYIYKKLQAPLKKCKQEKCQTCMVCR